MTILVIDPNADDREHICQSLRGWGYHALRACSNLSEAVSLLALDQATEGKVLYDLELIILDIGQGLDYPGFIHQIQNNPAYEDIPILVLSEGPRHEFMYRAYAYGAHDFMSKPIEDYELKSRVRSSLKLKYEIERRKAREHELIEVTHQLSDLNQILSSLSLIDSLTGIPNRRCFDDTLEQEWRRAIRHGGELAIIMMDIDFFKKFNDSYGHQQGDHCLQKVARRIQDVLRRPGDLIARYGGEEFAIILPNTNGLQAEPLCQKIIDAVRDLKIPHKSSSVEPIVTISMGIASLKSNHENASTKSLIELADSALYRAKNDGRNRFYIHTASSAD